MECAQGMIKILTNEIVVIVISLVLLRLQVSYHEHKYLKLSTRKALRKQKKNKIKKYIFGVKIDGRLKYGLFYRATIMYSHILILEAGVVVLGFSCILFKCINPATLNYVDSVIKVSIYVSVLIFSLNTILYLWDDRPGKGKQG